MMMISQSFGELGYIYYYLLKLSLNSLLYYKSFYLLSMSSQTSSQSNQEIDDRDSQSKLFQFDYFLSNSINIFEQWKRNVECATHQNQKLQKLQYLNIQYPYLLKSERFRTANIVRSNAFIHILQQALVSLKQKMTALFKGLLNQSEEQIKKQKQKHFQSLTIEYQLLQKELLVLLNYLQVTIDQGMDQFYSLFYSTFVSEVSDILNTIYYYTITPFVLWKILCVQTQLLYSNQNHLISIGGNASYYQNILRTILKKNTKLKEIYDHIQKEMTSQYFLIQAILEIEKLESINQIEGKEKIDFISTLKGLHFLKINLRSQNLINEFLFTSFHLDHLEAHRKFKNYEQLQNLFIRMLQKAKKQPECLVYATNLQLDKLPFGKRKRTLQLENQILDMIYNYIGTVKHYLESPHILEYIPTLESHQIYTSSKYILSQKLADSLIRQLVELQVQSKEAFSLGGLQVHKVYLQMTKLLKNIYLSYEHDFWLFPVDILIWMNLKDFLNVSQDIKADLKKTLYHMVNMINQDKMPVKLNCVNGKMEKEKVSRGQYLQVILYFLEDCRREQQYINLPDIIPSNIQTSILFIQSLNVRFNNKEPNEDQIPYFKGLLQICERFKLTIDFKWFKPKESREDREIQFNIEKGLSEQWMRKIYREIINKRDSEIIEQLFNRYTDNNGLDILSIANMLKFNHGLDPSKNFGKNKIRQQDLFLLLEEIKLILCLHFDIDNLNLDEEINLNYLHICLGLYNSSIQDAPGNQAYALILSKILEPYLRIHSQRTKTFRSKYPCFFSNWLYSSQILSILAILGQFIQENYANPKFKDDIIYKIKLVSQFVNESVKVDNDQLEESIMVFASNFCENMNHVIYLEGVQLFCLFLNIFPSIRKDTSIDFLLNSDTFSNHGFFDSTINHLQSTLLNHPKKQLENNISILNCMLAKLPQYMNHIGLVKTLKVISTYLQLRKTDSDSNITEFSNKILAIIEDTNPTVIFLKFIFHLRNLDESQVSLTNLFNEGTQIQNRNLLMLEIMENLFEKIMKLHQQGNLDHLKEVNFTNIPFLTQIIQVLDNFKNKPNSKVIEKARKILGFLILNYGKNEDFIYFAQKLNMFELICIDKLQLSLQEESLLIDLIVENYHKELQTQLIKKLVRQNKALSKVAEKAIQKITIQKRKVHAYHINRLIQINSRYPNEKIEAFLIENLGCERNNSPAKINQRYLIQDLSKQLEKIPKNICQQLLLKPVVLGYTQILTSQINEIFEKLLYLPIRKFDKINMQAIQELDEDNQEWEDDEEEEQTYQQRLPSKKEDKKIVEEESLSQEEQDENYINSDVDHEIQEEEDYCEDRPQFLQIFTNENKKDQLKLYQLLMVEREELDVYIDSDYSRLKPESQYLKDKFVVEKIEKIIKLLSQIDQIFCKQILLKTPTELAEVLTIFGLQVTITQENKQKLQNLRSQMKNKPSFLDQFFSDREESDDSNSRDDQEEEDYDDDNEEMYQDNDYEDDDDEEDNEASYNQIKKAKKKDKKSNLLQENEILQPPELLPTYSKIEQQISGGELKKQEITKILQIALFQLLHLPQSQKNTKHVISFYLDILQSGFGQMFLESFITVLRFQQSGHNLEIYLKERESVEIGLQYISMQDAINNLLDLLHQFQLEREKKQEASNDENILFKESGSLLPFAQDIITRFNLPIQNNCITLLIIYIQNTKSKIRNKIRDLNFNQGEESPGKPRQYKLKDRQLYKVIEKICEHKSNNHIWELIQDTIGLKVKPIQKLFACIKGYGNNLYKKLFETGIKILDTIKKSESADQSKEQHQIIHTLQNTYHVVSKLILSCRDEIKQFYFINKENVKKLFEEDGFDNEPQLKNLPSCLLKNRQKIMNNSELIKLTELTFHFIKHLKDKFLGKIEDKMLHKLIHYPKLLIQTSWLFISIFSHHYPYKWTLPSEVEVFFKKYPIGSYKFNNLQEACNLILHFLDLQSFCCNKFKQILIPVFIKNQRIGQQINLRFKMPNLNSENEDPPILVTRKCSFDMAFYQRIRSGITVQFFEEEGSDHGGLVRQLMIGWKGKGVGEEDFFIGKILGISFKQGVPYGGFMDIAMFVAITNYQPTIEFFEDFDKQIANSLKYIRNNDPTDLSLKFSIEKIVNGKLIQFELVPGGKDKDLTQQNKQEYIDAYLNNYFKLGRQKQLSELKIGFNSVVFPGYASIFTPFELLKQIRGEEIVDVKMLRTKAKYEEGYSQESAVIRWFWETVEGFNQQDMNRFIQFVTGSPKITVYNSNFSIIIEKVYDINCLPVAHTCFNTLDLPEYSSKQILQKKLMTAICEGNNSFGIL